MKLVVIGCGRVGSTVAISLAADGWDVTCIDDNEGSLARLEDWRGGFTGHAMDLDVLERAGIATTDAVVVATDGDNTNLVVGQVVQSRYSAACVAVRVLDPRRAAFFADRGLRTVCPTETAIATLTAAVRTHEPTAAS